MKCKDTYYFVGNAHLDPVWQWRWQEGSAEAKATIRSALDRMKEFPEYRFVCSSASVYHWIEEFAPEMAEEIRQRVAEGRFVIVGGWFVQPDCNNPSGEGFARQSLYSQRYFKEHFGKTATVGYNVDSFGHNLMLPQILKKSGMDSYIYMRPGEHEKKMDYDLFNWESPDGSTVTACRIFMPYNNYFDSPEELEKILAQYESISKNDFPAFTVFYGVGNHGGGPTVRNLEVIRAYREAHPEKKIVYSDISDFFDAVRSSEYPLPTFGDDLQHHASGCYSTVTALKTGIRRAEHALIAAEKYNLLAHHLCGKKTEQKKLKEAWKPVCFSHFHDSMGGCSIREVYDDAALMLGSVRFTAQVLENNALQTISWAIGAPEREYGFPVVVFNPNGFDVREPVTLNLTTGCIRNSQGEAVPIQSVYSTTAECTWRSDTLFVAEVPAMGYAVYYYAKDGQKAPDADSAVKAQPWNGCRTANEHGGTTLENESVKIRFEEYSGYITSFLDKKTGKERITGRAAVPTVIDEYYHDTWSHGKNFFADEMARFSDARVSVVESGPIRATIKVESRYNDSRLTLYFSLYAGEDKLCIRGNADWREKHKMLKLAFPMNVTSPEAYYEIPFGIIRRPADGEEEPGQRFTAVRGESGGYALINDGTYSSCVREGCIYQTILRSPIYGDHGGPRTGESEYTEQGQHRFAFALLPTPKEGFASVIREAQELNQPVTAIVETWHEGNLPKVYSGLRVSRDNIMLSACKRSEDDTGLVLRLYETDGADTEVTVSGDMLPKPLHTTLTKWSVNTYYLKDGAESWVEVLLTEYPL